LKFCQSAAKAWAFLIEICLWVEMDLCFELESGEAINLISLLKETNGIPSIIPDWGRIYNLFAPQSIGRKYFEAVAIRYWS